MKRFKRIKNQKQFSSTDSKLYNLTILEQLEPRILLSGEGLLSIDTPDPLLDSNQPVAEYVELLEEEEQVEIDLCQPIMTLSIDDASVHTGDKLARLDNDPGEDAKDNITFTAVIEATIDIDREIIKFFPST